MTSANCKPSQHQPTLMELKEKAKPMEQSKFDAITIVIAKWIAMNGRPLNIVTVSSAGAKALAHCRAEPASCPLECWRKCAPLHGLVAKLAFKYLASPATIVPCERLFSLFGHVVNSKHVSRQHKQTRLPQQMAEYGLSATKDFILE